LRIEFRQLHCVIAAVDHESFRRVAQASGFQESTISRRSRDLEDAWGFALFERNHASGKGIEPASLPWQALLCGALGDLAFNQLQESGVACPPQLLPR
jgi:Bacterial regulatory helix-turn-helix protein, lysR family